MSRYLFCICMLLSTCTVFGQQTEDIEQVGPNTDSTFIHSNAEIELFREVSELDPKRAAILSAILPGMGQIYNKQYWKVPIIYAGLTAFGHFINYNNDIYHSLRNAVISDMRGISHAFSNIVRNSDVLVRNRDEFRRNRDYLIILGSAFYLLNIVDAHVSAHLDEFNVNEDLALKLKPSFRQTNFLQVAGVSLVLAF